MAEAVVSMVVERLGEFLIEEAKFIHGVGEKVRDVRDELWWIQCFLKDADARHHKDHRVRTWIREIKGIAYDAGDVLESFILKVESKKGGGILNILKRYACIVSEGKARHRVGLEIQAIEARISKLTTRLQMYGIKSLSEDREGSSLGNQRGSQSRLSYSHVGQDDFVGRDADVDKLVEYLTDLQLPKVVSIWGMGGLGKTTLARQVFNHEKVKKHFDASAWVCISQKYQIEDIFRQILTNLLPNNREETKNLMKNDLALRLHREQQEKKCLVIIDDIWDSDTWDDLHAAFPIQDMKGKLLLTSRSKELATHVNPDSFIHEPGTLDENKGWDLLSRKAFSNSAHVDKEDFKEMKKLGKDMITQCGRLPLAIVVLGGILVTKPSLKEWKKVSENVKSYIKSGEGIGQRDKGVVMEVLCSSYDDLPYQLKPCFLYLGKFAEDSEIDAERLYQLWMAESMVLSEDKKEGESMMDVAERYLGELSQRCMVQVQLEENHEYGPRKFKSCRLHDLMRVFCLSQAKEEDFFNVIEFLPKNDDEHVESLSSTRNKTRRVVIFSEGLDINGIDIYFTKEVRRNLRSMLFFAGYSIGCLNSVVKSVAKNFRLLRVLAIEGLRQKSRWHGMELSWDDSLETSFKRSKNAQDSVALDASIKGVAYTNNPNTWGEMIETFQLATKMFHTFPLAKAVGSLIHLRYLSLRNSDFSMILLCLSNLKHLQTLDLRGTGLVYLSGMQNVLRKMSRLQYLYLPGEYKDLNVTKKMRFNGLSNLEIVENFDPSWCEVKDLSKLVHLNTEFKKRVQAVIDGERRRL